MKNIWFVIVGVLVVVLIGLLVWGFVLKPSNYKLGKQSGGDDGRSFDDYQTGGGSGGSSSGSGGGGSTGLNGSYSNCPQTMTGIPDGDILKLVKEFRKQFEEVSWLMAFRCGIVEQVNKLSSDDLRRFVCFYQTDYGKSPLTVLLSSSFACPFNDQDEILINRLKNLMA